MSAERLIRRVHHWSWQGRTVSIREGRGVFWCFSDQSKHIFLETAVASWGAAIRAAAEALPEAGVFRRPPRYRYYVCQVHRIRRTLVTVSPGHVHWNVKAPKDCGGVLARGYASTWEDAFGASTLAIEPYLAYLQ